MACKETKRFLDEPQKERDCITFTTNHPLQGFSQRGGVQKVAAAGKVSLLATWLQR